MTLQAYPLRSRLLARCAFSKGYTVLGVDPSLSATPSIRRFVHALVSNVAPATRLDSQAIADEVIDEDRLGVYGAPASGLWDAAG
jgi:hypothetical protein